MMSSMYFSSFLILQRSPILSGTSGPSRLFFLISLYGSNRHKSFSSTVILVTTAWPIKLTTFGVWSR
jgi:hypothetical protein